ncbi:sirohydrochlorin chelatase [Streptomyces cavernicola]|uniref:Sirohydrochlorin chelatase n=1 Tax=Streptomyces cavernicola TaxID=3043613 RepID=A0ABT6SEL5_9ACTN|nr:sirohydrochlorin chelatase [Streptomyces sp. B-S-A6]MDI3406294.1 sirohydrochlorin chelatase [Streptomyces sp. B-S-A6]
MTPTHTPGEHPGTPTDALDPLASTAQLIDRITSDAGHRLSHIRRPGLGGGRPPVLVVVAHGSRDPRTLDTVRSLLDSVRARRPELPVHLGHIELNEPLLPDTLARLAPGRAVLVPLLLGRGYHVKHDLPAAAAAAPHLDARVAAPLGPHPLLVDALYDRLVEAGFPAGARRRDTAVVLASAGSRDPEGRADTRGVAAALAERLGVPVVPAYASAAAPTVPVALRALAARGRDRVAVASYFTAPGRFAAQCAAVAPGVASAPLGTHPAMAKLLLHRYEQTLPAFATSPSGGLQLTSA